MAEYSMLWETGTTGDGSAAGYTQDQSTGLFHHTLVNNLTDEGILKNCLNALAATANNDPASPTVTIDTGAAWIYGFHYWLDAANDLALTLPVVALTGFRIVLRASYAPTRTVRLAVVMNTDGVSAIPAVTQTAGTTWEISLYTGVVDTGGDIWKDAAKTYGAGVMDTRVYCHPNIEVETAMLADETVTAAKIANRTRTVFVPIISTEEVGVGALTFNTTVKGFDMVDAAQCNVYGHWRVPEDFVSGLTFKTLIRAAGAGDVMAYASAEYSSNGEAVWTHSNAVGPAAVTVTTNLTEISAVTLSSAVAGDVIAFKFYRNASDPGDTVNASVYALGFIVSYTADS